MKPRLNDAFNLDYKGDTPLEFATMSGPFSEQHAAAVSSLLQHDPHAAPLGLNDDSSWNSQTQTPLVFPNNALRDFNDSSNDNRRVSTRNLDDWNNEQQQQQQQQQLPTVQRVPSLKTSSGPVGAAGAALAAQRQQAVQQHYREQQNIHPSMSPHTATPPSMLPNSYLRVDANNHIQSGSWMNDRSSNASDVAQTAPSSPHARRYHRSGSVDHNISNSPPPTHDAHGHPIAHAHAQHPNLANNSHQNQQPRSQGSAPPSVTITGHAGPSSGFNGATAREFFKSHLRAIAFTARLSHLSSHADANAPSDGPQPGEMSEEQFVKMAESLGREESLTTLRSMYQSLQQFRTLLVESRTLAGTDLQKEETFNRIVTRVRSVIQAESVVLFMLDRQAEIFYACATTANSGVPLNYAHGLNHSFCGHVLRYKSSLNLKFSAEKDPRYDPDLSKRLGHLKFRSVLAVPVFNKNANVIAVLLCINKRNSNKEKLQYFSEQDQSLVEFMSLLAGSTMENALLYDAVITRSLQQETMLQITELMAAEVDTSKVIARMIEASYLLIPAEKITLFWIDSEKEELVSLTRGSWGKAPLEGKHYPIERDAERQAASSSKGNNDAKALRISMSKGILGYCATSGKSVNVRDARKDWRFDPEVDSPDKNCPTVSLLVVPVTNNMSKPIAIIQAINKKIQSQPALNPITGGSEASLSPSPPQFAHSASTTSDVGSPRANSYDMSNQQASSHYNINPLHYFSKDEEALLQAMAVSAGIILRKAALYEEAVSTRKKSEALLQVSELMSADLKSEKIMSKIVQAAHMLVSCECILLYMVDEGASELVCEVGSKDGAKGSRIPLGHGVAGHTALTGRSLNIADAQNDWRFDPSEHSHFKNKVQTILAIPIKDYLGKNVGVIEFINKRTPNNAVVIPFSGEDEDVLNSLAFTAGAVLRKSRLFDEAISLRQRTEALLQVNEIMSAEIGTEKIMQRIIECSYSLVEAERITLFAVDPKTGELVCQVSKDPFFQGVRMSYGHGIVGHVALTRRSLNISNAYSDPRFNQLSDLKTGYKTHSILTVPVTDRKGQAVAVIQAVNKRGEKAFTAEDVTLLESMAVNAGQLLQKSRLYDAAVVADRKSRALVSLVMTATREDQSTDWIMHEIGRVAYDALCADRVYIFFCDAVQEQLTCVVAPIDEEEGWTIPLGRGIAGYVALTGELVNVEDAFKHGKFDPTVDIRGNHRPKSILCMGVKNNDGEVIAVVYCVNKRSAARQAQMQWLGQNVNPVPSTTSQFLAPPTHSNSYGGGISSPLRPQGPPPANMNAANREPVQTPPAGLNPYSSALPPMSGQIPSTMPLRRHSSRSSLMMGQASPWQSLRPSSSSADNNDRDGRQSSGSDLAGRISPMSSLPSPMRPDNNNNVPPHHLMGGLSSIPDPDAIELFTMEDEEILKALCAEVRSLLIRHVRETVLEMNQLSMNEGVYSLMDMYTGVVSSRSAVVAEAAHAHQKISSTTSGATGANAPGLKRPNTITRTKNRGFKAGAAATPSINWPIGTSKFNELLTLDFNVWTYSPDELLVFAYEMFNEMRLIDEFQIIPDTMKSFLLTVRSNYHDNPFHNWYHGFSVLHFSYLSLRLLTNASEYLTQHDVLALMVSSLCHDIDHPGNTNSFEINTGSELALIHNDLSVLENHHAYTTFRILRQKSTNIFCNLRKDTFQSLKKSIVAAILATDMINHFSECRNLDKCDTNTPFNIKVPADRQTVVNLLIHSSDLSAQCFPTSVAKIWEERITREFENQAAREKGLGIQVAEFMVGLANPVLRRQNQVNFISVVLIPWWRSCSRIFPGFKACYKSLMNNLLYYQDTPQSEVPSALAMTSTLSASPTSPDTTHAHDDNGEEHEHEHEHDEMDADHHDVGSDEEKDGGHFSGEEHEDGGATPPSR